MKKSKTISWIFLAVAVLIVLAAGGMLCGCENKNTSSQEQPPQSPQQPRQPSEEEEPAVKVDYEIIPYEVMPDNVKALVDAHKKEAGVTIAAANNSKYVFIALGARPTGGYSVVIKSVTERRGTVTVVYGEQKPEKGAMVTQAFTYPWIVIKIDTGLPIEVIRE